MKATTELNLRSAPPSAFLGINGKLIGTIKQDEQVTATDSKTVNTLSGKFIWYKVVLQEPGGGKKQEGWVYAGPQDNPYLKTVSGALKNLP
jgi:hypothetical protein